MKIQITFFSAFLSHRIRLSYIFERVVTVLACVNFNVEKTIMKGLVRFRNFFVTINTFRQINSASNKITMKYPLKDMWYQKDTTKK